jgi:hypothetical protein
MRRTRLCHTMSYRRLPPGKPCVNKINVMGTRNALELEGGPEQEEDCMNRRSLECGVMRGRNVDPGRILYIAHVALLHDPRHALTASRKLFTRSRHTHLSKSGLA